MHMKSPSAGRWCNRFKSTSDLLGGKEKRDKENNWARKALRLMLMNPCESEGEEPRLGRESLRCDTSACSRQGPPENQNQ